MHLYIMPSMTSPQTEVMCAVTITAKTVLLSVCLCAPATFISVKWSSIYQQIIITVSRAFSTDKGLPALALFDNSMQLKGIKSHTTIGRCTTHWRMLSKAQRGVSRKKKVIFFSLVFTMMNWDILKTLYILHGQFQISRGLSDDISEQTSRRLRNTPEM
ncbi:hypothetical protein ILYODFUR_003358 [Ilyodon furcidens]|uniref:Uncharacterized protein n=1 Tax=Ilyodon furcidens TaxID=33524 RepID=A0ABV0UCZ4_9TELE